jgi:MGT family glycosyltransferase
MPIRPVPYAEDLGVVPAWLQARKTRPRIYLTLGTVSFGAVEVLRRAVAETSELEVDVLVAVGPEGDPAALGDVSDNVHIERFVNQAQVLPLVDLAVTHGGTGTVLGALQAGLPQLLIPQGADQFFNMEILTTVGAARGLRDEEQAPGAIKAAAAALLSDCPERQVAQQLQAEINALPHPAEVVPQLVDIAGLHPTPRR